MTVTNTLAYYKMATITAETIFILTLQRVELSDSGKHSSLLRYIKITSVKRFLVKAPQGPILYNSYGIIGAITGINLNILKR